MEETVARVLADTGLDPRYLELEITESSVMECVPESLDGKGTARAWAAKRAGGAPIAVVSGADANALRAVARPLPHYGSQSFLVFDGSRASERGVWPATMEDVQRRLLALNP